MKPPLRWLICGFLTCALLATSLATSVPCRAQEGAGTWLNHTLDHRPNTLAVHGDDLWVGTWGGLLRWDLDLGTYAKYTPADGLVDTTVHDVAIDGLGRVWAGQERGLSLFDGSAWTTYDKDNSGIPGDVVFNVAVAPGGDVWLASTMVASDIGLGATVYDGDTWTTYDEGNSDLPDDHVTSIAFDGDGNAWVATRSGDVAKFDGATWTIHNDPTYNHESITVIGVDPSGRMWFTSPYNYAPVIMFDGQSWHHIIPENGCDYWVREGALDAAGQLWLSTWAGLCRYDGDTWTRYHDDNSELLSDWTHALAARGQTVWLGYWDASGVAPVTVTQFDGSAWDHLEMPDFLPRSFGQGIAADAEGRKWFGLAPQGVAMFDDENWTLYDSTNSGLPDTCTVIIATDLAGHLWFAGDSCGGGLVEFDGVDWTQHYAPGGVPHHMVQSVAVDQDNHVWAGSQLGLSVYDGVGWFTYNTSNSGLPADSVDAVVVDGASNIWAGCTTRFDGLTWETYASPEAAVEAYFDDIVATYDHDFRCWVADEARGRVWRAQSTSGIKAYDGLSWQSFSDADIGLIHPYTWRAWPQGLDGAGNLWVVASDGIPRYGGVSRFDGTTWTPYRQPDGLLEPPAFHMAADQHNHVWFIGGAGVSEFYDPWQPMQATITPAGGGTLISADGSTAVQFPPGAVGQDTIVTYTPMPPSPTGQLVDIGHFFDLSAAPIGFAAPAIDLYEPCTVTVEYADQELGTAIEATLGLYWWDGDAWLLEPSSSVELAQNRVTASLDHISLFAVLGLTNRLYLPLVMRR